jgi:endonuclease III
MLMQQQQKHQNADLDSIIQIVQRMGLMGQKAKIVKAELEDIREWHVRVLYYIIQSRKNIHRLRTVVH